jgi:hypothetical protein
MRPESIKIYGERNCGTNYLQNLIQRNLDTHLLPGVAPRRVRRLVPNHPALHERLIDAWFGITFRRNLGWKHMLAPDIVTLQRTIVSTNRTLFIFLSKNPYAWLLSLHRHPYHFRGPTGNFNVFIRSEWPTVGRENHPNPFPNLVVMWNRKNRSYLQLAHDLPHSLILRYEDMVTDPESVINTIAEELEISLKNNTFINIQASVKDEKDKDFAWYRTYYQEERWREQLDDDALRFINRNLDQDVLHTLGYDRT